MDFLKVNVIHTKKGVTIQPEFICGKSKDLMIRGHDFYAVWDDENQKWSTDEDIVIKKIDRLLDERAEEYKQKLGEDQTVNVKRMAYSSSGSMDAWLKYTKKQMFDNYIQLDESLTFSDTPSSRDNYSTKSLKYSVKESDTPAYEEIISTLYSPEERMKIEWAIGAILSGDSKKIQKFIVLYGEMGTGKSTILNIIQMLFDGYYTVFDAETLGSRSSSFSLEQFKSNPLVAIQHDGDLSHIETNTRLNSIVSHEEMQVNEKFKSLYKMRFHSFLFMGTNKPVRITDAKSGIIRRLIDVHPTGDKLSRDRYEHCMDAVKFELGGIAHKCLWVYLNNKTAYDNYIPFEMMNSTNDFYNFVLDNYDFFLSDDYILLKSAWGRYKEYVDYAKINYPMSLKAFTSELRNYFREFLTEVRIDGKHLRSVFKGFRTEKFEQGDVTDGATFGNVKKNVTVELPDWLKLEENNAESASNNVFNQLYSECPAQYALIEADGKDGRPKRAWDDVTSTLIDLNTQRVHYVRIPENHICIDFDLKDENGNKSLERNLVAASKFPKTYAEVSKGGGGLHLHYIYDGDVSTLSRVYDDNIEVKVFTGKSSLRRRLILSNNESVVHINSGLPLRGDPGKVINWETVNNEKALRTLIIRSLRKEYHPGTKPSIDFIKKFLDDAYLSGVKYDVTDLRPSVMNFAQNSTHHADYCMTLVCDMRFKSEEPEENNVEEFSDDREIIFYDVEVFKNLFVVCWKKRGSGGKETVVKMINPTPEEIERFMELKRVGFNNRKYDAHMIYGRMLGYSNMQLYELSQRIVTGSENGFFGEAYNIDFADVYDFTILKQSLKQYEIDLGINHQELPIPWDEEVPEERWAEVADYCANDVVATEIVFESRQADFMAREILSDLSGLPIISTTRQHITKIIFGNERHPNLEYTDLSTIFPGYEFNEFGIDKDRYNKDENGKPIFTTGKSLYFGEDPSEGGYVYAVPGMYYDVVTFDVSGMHPASIIALNKFGEKTKIYKDIIDARLAIKHHDYESARKMLDGKLEKYLTDEALADKLSKGLKLIANSTYGFCSATFDNPFRDKRDKDNIVAKRGALFMITLKNEVLKRGFKVIHCKTDSIKVVKPNEEITKFIYEFGKQYGYTFEVESEYERICLVNRAVYIAKEKNGEWTATGAEFQHPYIFKTLFSHEPIGFRDLCEAKNATNGGALYLDMNENMLEEEARLKEEIARIEKENRVTVVGEDGKRKRAFSPSEEVKKQYDELVARASGLHNYIFIGRTGLFCPVMRGKGGGELLRMKDNKYAAVTGTKGYRWLESEVVKANGKENDIDKLYFSNLVDSALDTISKFGDPEEFIN